MTQSKPETECTFRAGDRVRLNGHGEGRVLRLVGEMVEVVEHQILGRRAVWRLRPDVLTRVSP
jgi:hypothetical protein